MLHPVADEDPSCTRSKQIPFTYYRWQWTSWLPASPLMDIQNNHVTGVEKFELPLQKKPCCSFFAGRKNGTSDP
ncbi:MAG: hypothetical protein WDO71_25895 [Bacteroidota bacterium]